MFGVDKNINISTIDEWLGRPEVAYRDVRMLFDPADYGAIGGNADLSSTIVGFKIVPYPYPVSYTHLDVYKRQTTERLRMSSGAQASPRFTEA